MQTSTAQTEPQVFPTLQAESLDRNPITFPDDLDQKVNILILVFEQQAQRKVDTWASIILNEYEPQEDISYYEVPMISTWYYPISWQIDNWMRGGIPSQYHKNTTTFYGNRKPYFEALNMTDISSCYTFLLDESGHICYRWEGAMDAAKESEFRLAIETMRTEN